MQQPTDDTSSPLRKKLSEAGDGTRIIPMTANEVNQLKDKAGAASMRARSPHKSRLIAVVGRVEKLLEDPNATVPHRSSKSSHTQPSATTELLFQFRITLRESDPPIWRQIQVRDCTLDKLHEHIQTSMGWTNSHLYEFTIRGKLYGDPVLLDDGFAGCECIDSTQTLLSEVLPAKGRQLAFEYTYDFGDNWEHTVLFEGYPPVDPQAEYPLCLEGARACPPEDCGGVWGYENMLEALSNPDHEEHAELLEWTGGGIDSEAFDAKTATQAMKTGLVNWRDEND
ncbi:MAG: plasmid pRiA4b ORF-3 family protein [Planctomycetota bacterium]